MASGKEKNGIEEIYEKYYKDVYRFVLALSKNPHIAEDIIEKRYKRSRHMLGASRGVCVLHKESSHLRGALLMKIKCCEFRKFFTAFFIVYILSDFLLFD